MKMRNSKILNLDSDWWKTERKPAESIELVAKRRSRLPNEKLYPLKHYVDQLQVGKDLLYDACKTGDLQYEIVGRQYRIAPSWIEQWLELCRKKKRRA